MGDATKSVLSAVATWSSRAINLYVLIRNVGIHVTIRRQKIKNEIIYPVGGKEKSGFSTGFLLYCLLFYIIV